MTTVNYNSPIDFVQLIKHGQNPQQLVMQVLEQQAKGNPLYANLLSLAKTGKGKEIEVIAMAKEKGIDFDTEFTTFKQMFGF